MLDGSYPLALVLTNRLRSLRPIRSRPQAFRYLIPLTPPALPSRRPCLFDGRGQRSCPLPSKRPLPPPPSSTRGRGSRGWGHNADPSRAHRRVIMGIPWRLSGASLATTPLASRSILVGHNDTDDKASRHVEGSPPTTCPVLLKDGNHMPRMILPGIERLGEGLPRAAIHRPQE